MENYQMCLVDKTVGSRVIVTTRNIDVANFCALDGEVYELDPLNDEDSKRLLSKRVFIDKDGIYSELEEVTNKILKKCGGIPLAIITTASLLASRPNKTKYEWYSVYSSMGSGLHKDKSLDSMRAILYLSYSDLPSYLKPCLLYLSMFPEDYKIPSDDLVRLWIAEGFIDENQGIDLYGIGKRYFNELVNRSMIQPIYRNGFPTACRVHDMVLDLIISLSAQENFVTILEGPCCDISTACKIRRLSVRGNKVDSKEEQMIFPEAVNISHVRSIIVFGDVVPWMPPISKFPVLRVLAFRTVSKNNIHPKDIGSLQHLRYLELGGELKIELLEGIGNLKLLKTLDLWGPIEGELPASITQRRRLENFLIGFNGLNKVKFPDGTGNLISLHELSWLCVGPNTLVDLGNLTKLRVLKIYGFHKSQSYMKTFLQVLSNLVNLHTLALCGRGTCSIDCVPDQWTGPAHLQMFDGNRITLSLVPRWFSFLSELSSLSILVNMLRQEDLELIGDLPVLRFLKLEVNTNDTITEEQLVVGASHPFRSLAEFKFKHYTRCWLEFDRGVMPNLQRLQLDFEVRKRKGGGFDIGLEHLASLKYVTVKVDCDCARTKEVENVECQVRDTIDMHPNHSTLDLSRSYEGSMIEDEESVESDEDYIEDQDEDGPGESEANDEVYTIFERRKSI